MVQEKSNPVFIILSVIRVCVCLFAYAYLCVFIRQSKSECMVGVCARERVSV